MCLAAGGREHHRALLAHLLGKVVQLAAADARRVGPNARVVARLALEQRVAALVYITPDFHWFDYIAQDVYASVVA